MRVVIVGGRSRADYLMGALAETCLLYTSDAADD